MTIPCFEKGVEQIDETSCKPSQMCTLDNGYVLTIYQSLEMGHMVG
jgi:hypothetical protein